MCSACLITGIHNSFQVSVKFFFLHSSGSVERGDSQERQVVLNADKIGSDLAPQGTSQGWGGSYLGEGLSCCSFP